MSAKSKPSPYRTPLNETIILFGTLILSSVNFMSFNHFLPLRLLLLHSLLWSVFPSNRIRLLTIILVLSVVYMYFAILTLKPLMTFTSN